MPLRFLSALLVVLGAFPLIWSMRMMSDDPRRAAAVAGLSLIGVSLHLLVAGDIRLRVRPALRLTALAAVGIMLLGVILGLRRLVVEVIPTVPLSQVAARDEFHRVVLSLQVLAGVLVYVGLGILMLRRPSPPAVPVTPAGPEQA
jgi:hypothetical protein